MFEENTKAEYFIMIDADNTYDISNINKNINLMKK